MKSRTTRKTKNPPNYRLQTVKPNIVYRLFNPQVPVIVCSQVKKDIAAMPANSCASVSDSPPMISLALKLGSRTNMIVRLSSGFSINWINFEPERSRRIVQSLAKHENQKYAAFDKLKQYDIPYSIIRGIPVLREACAFVLCRVQKRFVTGDHDLFISRVICAKAIGDFTKDEYWQFKKYKPVLYIGSIRPNPIVTLTK